MRMPSRLLLFVLALAIPALTFGGCVGPIGCWGSPMMKIVFENQSGEDLTVFIEEVNEGTILDRGTLTASVPLDISKYRIRAVNGEAETVFSQTMTRQDMEEIDSLRYRVVIR
jgi:hypothetical protein